MGEGQVIPPAAIRHKLHDTNVQFEEYIYYAKIQREQEKNGIGPEEREKLRHGTAGSELVSARASEEKLADKTDGKVAVSGTVNTTEAAQWETASRAGRNASWAAVYVSSN